jgi:hypothetical protein
VNQDEQPPSTLAIVLGACRSLVRGMLAELDVMEKLERDLVAQENEWVRRMNTDDGGGRDENDIPRTGAIWRAF